MQRGLKQRLLDCTNHHTTAEPNVYRAKPRCNTHRHASTHRVHLLICTETAALMTFMLAVGPVSQFLDLCLLHVLVSDRSEKSLSSRFRDPNSVGNRSHVEYSRANKAR